MKKRLSPIAIQALKEALCNIYWYKADLRSFLQNCLQAPDIINKVNWSNYKRQIVSDVVDVLVDDQERHLAALTKLCIEITKQNKFPHLEQLEDGARKAKLAADTVANLRELVTPHKEIEEEERKIEERKKAYDEKLKQSKAVLDKLEEIKRSYISLFNETAQKRGFQLERVLYSLFDLFDLDPKASFRIEGEQIDGSFTLDGTDYLFEAKWQECLTGRADLDVFSQKISRKLDNTLGLFLSINGFEESAVNIHSASRSNMLLMTGADLMGVLEGRIDFHTFLLRKKRHAAQTGNILLQIHQIL